MKSEAFGEVSSVGGACFSGCFSPRRSADFASRMDGLVYARGPSFSASQTRCFLVPITSPHFSQICSS